MMRIRERSWYPWLVVDLLLMVALLNYPDMLMVKMLTAHPAPHTPRRTPHAACRTPHAARRIPFTAISPNPVMHFFHKLGT